MGTYYGYKTEVIGPKAKVADIKQLIKADEELAPSLDQWDRNIKNWSPGEKLKHVSEHCDGSCVLLTTAEEAG